MVRKYNLFLFENYLEEIENIPLIADVEILESIVVDSESLMSNVETEMINFYGDPFNFDMGKYDENYSLEQLRENSDFNKILSKKELFISELNNTKDYETFISDDIKYMLIHKRLDRSMNKLEKLGDPLYIIFQTKDMNKNWVKENIKIYKINGNFNNFYKKLSSKTIEISKDGEKYVYISNGKNWVLKNTHKKNNIFKDVMYSDDIKVILNGDNVTITIVP